MNYIKEFQSLLQKYDQKEKCGIFFNLNETKNPLDIIGVLDFLKFKIQSWRNTNIYSYQGALFDNNIIIVIGSNNVEEAIIITIFVYLSRLAEKDPKLLKNALNFESTSELEDLLKEEFEKKFNEGYPNNPQLEQKLKLHLEKLLET